MMYSQFVKKLQESFANVIFEEAVIKENKYAEFYNYYNPVQVEIEYNNVDLLLLPYSKIEKLTGEYAYLESDFVFGLANADPYFVKDGKVYTCYHGDAEPVLELLANSFDEFLRQIMEEF